MISSSSCRSAEIITLRCCAGVLLAVVTGRSVTRCVSVQFEPFKCDLGAGVVFDLFEIASSFSSVTCP